MASSVPRNSQGDGGFNTISPEAVKQFVDEFRRDYRKANPAFKPFAMEGALRVLFGEEHLLDEISPADQLQSQFLTIRKIVDRSQHMPARLDDYLADAEVGAAQRMND